MKYIYLEIYRIIYPVFLFIVKLLSPFNSKLKNGFKMREEKNRLPPWLNFRDLKDPILIHCASGEFEYAKPVIREIKRLHPKTPVVITYFSPSYEAQIKKTEGVDFSCPLPWDYPGAQREFLKKLNPKHILISRTDLWPEFLHQASLLKIPVAMFSTVLSSKSSKIKNIFIRSYQRWIFSFLSHVYCVSNDDKKNLSQLIDSKMITAIGDTRFDQVLYRIAHPNRIKNSLLPKDGDHSIFIAGSTWDEDEDQIIPLFKYFIENNIQVILAPHEPSEENIDIVQKKLTDAGLKSLHYTQISHWPATHVLIIDQMGVLADLYAWADWAFVGGSFKKQVHSVMEPLAQGCKTFFGPYHHNNREAILFKDLGYASSVENGEEMYQLILKNRNVDTTTAYKENLKKIVREKAGASQKLVQVILKD